MPELQLSLSNAEVQLLHDRKSNAAHFGIKYPSFGLSINPNHLKGGYAFKMTIKLGARQWYLYPGIKEHILKLQQRGFYYPLFCEAVSLKDRWSYDDDLITEIKNTLTIISLDAFTIKGTSKHNGFVYLEPKRLEILITASFELNSDGVVSMSLPIHVKKSIVKMFKDHMDKIDKPTRAQIKEHIESLRVLDDPYDYNTELPF